MTYLRPYQEIVGGLVSVEEYDVDVLKLTFTTTIDILVRKDPTFLSHLEEYIGQRIALLNLDNVFYVKQVDEK